MNLEIVVLGLYTEVTIVVYSLQQSTILVLLIKYMPFVVNSALLDVSVLWEADNALQSFYLRMINVFKRYDC